MATYQFPVNILDGSKFEPTMGLEYAAGLLQQAAGVAGKNSQDGAHALNNALEQYQSSQKIVAPWITSIRSSIQDIGYRGTDVNRAADDKWQYWAQMGINLFYKLDEPNVNRSFAQFVLSVVTHGFKGKDTTGTTMGNYQGGGFGAMGQGLESKSKYPLR